MNKQISLTMPKTLFDALKSQTKKTGHRTSQEYILQLLREELLVTELDRTFEEMKTGKNGLHFKNEKEAIDFLWKNHGNQKK